MNDKDEAKQFRKSLQDFWTSRGLTNLKIPQIGGRELNLFHLYKAVCKRGGAQMVSQNKHWKEIVNEFGLPPSCTSASFTLRNHYSKYLLAYEQKYLFGREDDTAIPELVGLRQRKQVKKTEDSGKEESPPPSVAGETKGGRDNVHSSLAQTLQEKYRHFEKNQEIFYTKKNKLFPTVSEIKRILLAFESHLQEEILFAINSLLLYSSNTNVSFMLEQYPALLDNITHYLEVIVQNVPHLIGKDSKICAPEKLNVFDNYNYPLCDLVTNEDVKKEPFDYLKGIERKYCKMKYELVSEVELIEQTICISQVLRNLSFIKSNDHTIFKHEKLHPLLIDLFLYTSNPSLQKNCLEIFSNTSKFVQLKSLNCDYLLFCLRLLSLLRQDSLEEAEASVETLRHLIIFQENESILEDLFVNNLEDLNNLLISTSLDIREGVLELFCFLSDLKMSTRVAIARQPKCLMRLIALLSSRAGKKNEKITKLCALILSNVSLAPASKGCLLPYERDLFIVAATDDSVSKIISNVLGDLDNIVAEGSFKG